MIENKTCFDIEDCNYGDTPKVCYEDVQWSQNSFFCNCSSWYGFTGSNCTVPSFQTKLYITTLIVTLVWMMILILFVSYEMNTYLRNQLKVGGKFSKFNPIFTAS